MKNKRDLSLKEIAALLQLRIHESRLTRIEWAAQNDISEAEVSQVLNCKEKPKLKMREVLGIERVVVFRVKGVVND